MNRIITALQILATAIFFNTVLMAQAVQYPEIAKEIVEMRDQEQKERVRWAKMAKKGKTDTDKFREMTLELIAGDRRNTARMQEIVKEIGWPTFDKVGKGPSSSAWLLVQHADRNPRFQMYCLELMKIALDNDQVDPANYAFLYDRAHVNHGLKQLYATQSSTNNGITEGEYYPLEDESNVQKRRTEMGIDQSVVDYAKGYGFEYEIPSIAEAQDRDRAYEAKYQDHIQKGRTAMMDQDYEQAAIHYKTALACHGYTNTADYVEGARALSLSKDKVSNLGITYLIKAICRGVEGYDAFERTQDFQYFKTNSPFNWIDLENLLKEIREDQ